MKLLRYAVLLGCLALAAGCAAPPPFELNPVTPDLKIVNKRPLKVAVVVHDPMPYTLYYKGQGGYSRDMTAESRNKGFPLERDLSKICSDTFSQVFSEVVISRDLPQPGQYDAVVNLSIGQILMKEHVIVTGETCDVTAEWSMDVLDRQNREIFSKKGISPSHNFSWSVMNPARGFTLGINSTMSSILGELAEEWGATLSTLQIPGANP